MGEASDDGVRHYVRAERRYPSVTSILAAAIPKPGLVNWAAKTVARETVDRLAELAHDPRGKDAIVAELASAPTRRRDAAGARGDNLHAFAEAVVLGQPTPEPTPTEEPYVAALLRWLEDRQPEFELSEATVYSDRYGYAGRLDWVARIGERVILGDYKSGGRIYPEMGLQLVAYANADVVVVGDEERPMPAIDAGMILHVTPDGYTEHEVDVSPAALAPFLSALEVAKWTWANSSSRRKPVDTTDAHAVTTAEPATATESPARADSGQPDTEGGQPGPGDTGAPYGAHPYGQGRR